MSCITSVSLHSRCLEVVGERENGHALGRHAREETGYESRKTKARRIFKTLLGP